jgi:hypothetical protein
LIKYLYILFLTIFISNNVFCQEVTLSQPFAASQYQNPSGVGGSGFDNRFQALNKSQLIDGNSLYRTFLVSFDTRLKKDIENSKNYLGIGAQIISDQLMAGIMQNNYLSVNLAYHLFLDDELNSNLSLGFGTTFTSIYLDRSKLKFNDQYDYRAILVSPSLENLVPNPFSFTTNAGAMYTRHSENSFFQTGFMTYLNNKPNVTYSPYITAENLRYRAFLNTEIPVFNDNSLLLYFNYLSKGTTNQMYFGGMVGLPIEKDDDYLFKMYVGCFYKLNEAYIPTISFISKKSTFGVSYDVYSNTISGADLKQNGFELTYSQKFGQLRKYRYRTVFD